MSLGERVLRAIEGRIMPWFSREEAEKAERHSEEIRQRSIKARIEVERVQRIYLERLVGSRTPR